MDEPIAGLAAEGTKEIIVFLDVLRHEASILMVEHDMDAGFAIERLFLSGAQRYGLAQWMN